MPPTIVIPTDQNSNHKIMKMKTKTKTMAAAMTTSKRGRPSAVGNDESGAPDDGESGYYDVERWTSRHYDNNKDGGDDNEEVEKDLFDPDPKKNRSFVGGRDSFGEGADDDGMFLR